MDGLREHYGQNDGGWVRTLVAEHGADLGERGSLGRVEEVACGLRWLEVADGVVIDLARSLRCQLPRALLD